MSRYHLHEKIFIRGTLTTLTGLVIGGSDTALSIGGLDKTVVRDPATNRPYIPGSSLKGKIRSLLELAQGWVGGKGGGLVEHGANMHPDGSGARLCGTAITGGKKLDAQNAQWIKEGRRKVSEFEQRPSPLIVRDGYLHPTQYFPHADLGHTHTKTEVSLDRITAKANPRTIERVPPGAQFALDMVLNIYQEEGESDADRLARRNELMHLLLQGLSLLQDDYLGGNGSRGSGQVAVYIDRVFTRNMDWYRQPDQDELGVDIMAEFNLPASLLTAPPSLSQTIA